MCLVTGEVLVGSDGQNTQICHLHVPVCLPYKIVARVQVLASQDRESQVEEIYIAFYDLTWRSERVLSVAFCSSRKLQNSASFLGSRKTPLVDGEMTLLWPFVQKSSVPQLIYVQLFEQYVAHRKLILSQVQFLSATRNCRILEDRDLTILLLYTVQDPEGYLASVC